MRVVVADDSVLLREGLVRLLEEADFEVVAQAGDADDLLRKVRAHKPDLALVDVRMPPTHTDEGLRAAREIRAELPEVSVLVLSQDVEEANVERAVRRQRRGARLPAQGPDRRPRHVHRGSEAGRRTAARRSIPRSSRSCSAAAATEDPLEALSPREREVLEQMAEGRSNAAIAEKLVITDRAVEKHVGSIFSKLDLAAAPEDHRRVLAVLRFLET